MLFRDVRDLKHTKASRFFDVELELLHSQEFVADFFEPEQLDEAPRSSAADR